MLSLVTAPGTAAAHERFVRHRLVEPLHDSYFRNLDGWGGLGIQPDMLEIAVRVFGLLAFSFVVWYLRHPLQAVVDRQLMRRVGGRWQRGVHLLTCFLMDRPVRNRAFHAAGEWAVILFLRSPGLVLMYSATNNSLVMPSYPLDPASAAFFQYAQVALAALILTQTLLPVCGAMILGTWLYMFRWGWLVAADALPVLAVAMVYVLSPWQSHRLAITRMSAQQLRLVRIVLGFGFLVLGWLKLYNHDLVGGVADQYPWVMGDPMIRMFWLGTDPVYARESWIVAFGLSEVMSGFMLLVGVFTRVWCTVMAIVLAKLMFVDFGWEEIPHIFPIAALLALLFSNRLTSELEPVERMEAQAARQRRPLRQLAIVSGASIGVAFLIIFPALYLLTFADRSGL